jgi:hypothetical protein
MTKSLKISGKFIGTLTNHKTGEIFQWEKHNMVVQAGFNWLYQLMSNKTSRPQAITHIAFGTGTTTTTSNMTALVNEVYRASVTANWDPITREITFSGTIPTMSGLNVSISEVGLFNAATGGTMFDRATFSPKGIDDQMSFDYNFVITLTE